LAAVILKLKTDKQLRKNIGCRAYVTGNVPRNVVNSVASPNHYY